MNRRKFLQGATALFCAPAIIKADALMKVSSGLIIPEQEIYTGNEILTPEMITRETLRILHKRLVFTQTTYRLSG